MTKNQMKGQMKYLALPWQGGQTTLPDMRIWPVSSPYNG